ncbi:hypothetical protein ABID26_001211 [Mesorhizobium shonense]|uniref:Uncharacterized protein n=1 Tax=Mesorhizobium shonense TaxID=1209948 RepID=A0ABV2HNE0_9HYPH
MRYVVTIDSQPDLTGGFFADFSDAKRHAEGIAAERSHAEICIDGYPAAPGGPMPTWRYDRDVASWVPTGD